MATNFSLALILLVRYVSARQEEHLIEIQKNKKKLHYQLWAYYDLHRIPSWCASRLEENSHVNENILC